jgi:hypothetical protein
VIHVYDVLVLNKEYVGCLIKKKGDMHDNQLLNSLKPYGVRVYAMVPILSHGLENM